MPWAHGLAHYFSVVYLPGLPLARGDEYQLNLNGIMQNMRNTLFQGGSSGAGPSAMPQLPAPPLAGVGGAQAAAVGGQAATPAMPVGAADSGGQQPGAAVPTP